MGELGVFYLFVHLVVDCIVFAVVNTCLLILFSFKPSHIVRFSVILEPVEYNRGYSTQAVYANNIPSCDWLILSCD